MTEYSMIPLLSAIIYIVLIAVVIVYRPLQKQHYFFLVYLVAALTWAIANSLLLSQFYMGQKLLLFRLTICASVWWAVQLYYFSRIFLKLNGGFGVKVGYTSLVCLIVFALLGYAPPDIIIDNGIFAGPVYGWWFYIYLFSLLFLAATIIYVLVQRFRATSNPVDRNKISYLTLAIGFWVLFGFIGITPLAQGGKFPITHIGGFLSAFVLAYAILKHELVSISAILRRSLGWALLFMVGVSIYVVILYALTLVFNHKLTTQALILATVSSILVSIFIYWLRPFFLTMVGYFFFRDTYTYRQMILSFDRDIGNIISLDELADKMLDLVLGALRVLKISLILRNPSNNDYITRYVYPTTKKLDEELKFDSDNPIIDWLEKETYPLNLTQIDNISQFEGLWQTEREVLVNSGIELLFPIKYRNELIGMLALGKKRGNTSYSHEDIELLISMAGKAGIIIENARMFETLIQQQHQVQHLLTEAIQAQENERQRISADLHDSVAQWLAGASYQTQTVEALLPDTNGSNVRNQLNLVEETIDKSLTELRRVLVDLRPPSLDELGLSHSLHQSLMSISSDGLVCKFHEEGDHTRLDPSVEITVYRVVQEALNNIRKHAEATKVDLYLSYINDDVIVKIKDNGIGFNLTDTINNAISVGSLGLLGMKQRVDMLGGKFDIQTRQDKGTTITLTLPLQPPKEES